MGGRRRTGVRILSLLLVGALPLAGCGDDHEPVTAGAGPGGTALAAEYVSVEVTAGGEPRPLVEGTEIRLRFDDDQLSASLGCNQLVGSFRVDGTRLVVDGLSSTEMGCDPALHEQDQWFADLLTTDVQLLTSGDELAINDGFTAVVFRDAEVAEPDLPLLATTWQVDGFVEGSGPDATAVSAAVDPPGTLQLLGDGVVAGFDGCDQLGDAADGGGQGDPALRFEVDGDELRFSGTPPDELAGCEAAAAEHAERYRAVLSGTVTWSVAGDRLTITAADGRGVTYRAVGA